MTILSEIPNGGLNKDIRDTINAMLTNIAAFKVEIAKLTPSAVWYANSTDINANDTTWYANGSKTNGSTLTYPALSLSGPSTIVEGDSVAGNPMLTLSGPSTVIEGN